MEQAGPVQTGHNVFAHSRNYFSGGYTSHDLVTAGPRCAITTALQSSTSIHTHSTTTQTTAFKAPSIVTPRFPIIKIS